MLLWLIEYLTQYYSGFNAFQYITMRAILGALTALLVALVAGPRLIHYLDKYQIGQEVRDDGPETHLTKVGTPTMGGLLILLSVSISTLCWADLSNRFVWVVFGVILAFGTIGWIDDYRKIVRRNPAGLKARWKYLWQSVFGLLAAVFLYLNAEVPAETRLILPFVKSVNYELGLAFILLVYFVIVGSSNAVNLTDGLDGLAILPVVMVAGGLTVFAYVAGHVKFADYLNVPYIPGVGEVCIICGAIAGSGLGFLWFNTYPAQVFMGDIGALSLGGRLGNHRRRRPAGARVFHHGRGLRRGDPVRHPASGLLQTNGPAPVPHGAPAPPLRTQRLARTQGHRPVLDHHRGSGADRAGDPEAPVSPHGLLFRFATHD